MPTFRYKAKNGPGETVEGDLEAHSREGALAALDELGYSPISVTQKEKSEGRAARASTRRISSRDITLFTRQLASLTRSGVPILRSLTTIAEQTDNALLRATILELEASIREGSMLSGALAKYPSLFPDLFVNMVKSGESAGILDTTLARLADAREKEEELRRKVQAAMAYPLLILGVGLATVFVLLSFFLPRVVVLFKDYRDLPLPTRILMDISSFFSGNWYWLLLAVALVAVVVRRLAALEKGRAWLDRLELGIPMVRKFVLETEIARFARTLSLLIEAGVPIDRALSLSGATMRNGLLQAEIEIIRRSTVVQGVPLSVGMKKSLYFPPLVANMTAVGEEAGRLDESLGEVASFYENDVEQQTRLATSLLEPILILGVGGVVGFIVAAMLLPIFRLSTSL